MKTWLLALAITLLVLSSWELMYRGRGAVPSQEDGLFTWAQAYQSVQPDSIVLLGASRIQAGVDPNVLARMTQRTVVQLAVRGSSAIPVLELLASESWFHGTAIVDLIPRIVFDATRERETRPIEYIRAIAEGASPASWIESHLTAFADRHLAFRRPDFAVRSILRHGLIGALPSVPHTTMDASRFTRLDFTRVDASVRRMRLRKRIATHGRPADDQERDLMIVEIVAYCSQIESRGGRVVFVHMPTTGGIRGIEEERYPRAAYWDVLADRLPGKMFHFADYPSLASFTCPDESHLDFRDTAAFTTNLARVLGY